MSQAAVRIAAAVLIAATAVHCAMGDADLLGDAAMEPQSLGIEQRRPRADSSRSIHAKPPSSESTKHSS